MRFRDTQANTILRDIMMEFDLIDVWRERNPELRRYTWRRVQPLQQSRIDYFLVSNTLIRTHRIVRSSIEAGVRSDHVTTVSYNGVATVSKFVRTLLDGSQKLLSKIGIKVSGYEIYYAHCTYCT